MIDSKFIDILRLLDKEEQKNFLKFTLSPYYNSDKSLPLATEYLLEHQTDTSGKFTKEALHKFVFGKKTYSDVAIRVILSKLYKLICQFINTNPETPGSTRLLRFLRKNHQEKYFLQILQQKKQALESASLRNENFYDRSYRLFQEEYEFLKSQKRQIEYPSQQVLENIELAYFIKKLKHAIRVLSIQSINKIELELPFIHEIGNYIQSTHLIQLPVLAFYYYSYLILLNPNDEIHFDKIYRLLVENEIEFDEHELRDNYLMLLNYCIRKINDGDSRYNETLFNLYVKSLEKEFLLEQGVMTRFTYRNISESGIKIGKYNWVEQFLIENKNRLERKYRNSFYALQRGRLHIVNAEYNQALDLLSTLSFQDPLIELAYRLEKIRIFIELEEYDLAEYQLSAMDAYLRRKKGVGYHREHYQNFILFTKRLIKVVHSEPITRKELYALIEKSPKLTEKKWLLDKIKHKL